MKEHGKITERQFAGIIANTIIGVGVLTLPRIAAKNAGTAGWLSLLIAAFFALLNLLLIIKLGRRFPEETIMEYSPRVLGKIPGIITALIICVYWFFIGSFVFRLFSEMLIQAVLESTPMQVLFISMMIIVAYFIRHDIQVIGRINELYFILIVLPAIFGAVLSLKEIEPIKLLPLLGKGGFIAVIKGAGEIFLSFAGFEVVLIFLPSITTSSLAYNYAFKGWISPVMIYFAILIAATGIFGTEELLNLTWPTLELVKVTNFPGLVLERVEVIFVFFWVIAVFTTVSNFLYSSLVGLSQILKIKDHRTLVFPLLPLFFIIGMYPDNISDVFKISTQISKIGALLIFIFPVLIYIIAVIKGIRGDERA